MEQCLIKSDRVYFEHRLQPAILELSQGKIANVLQEKVPPGPCLIDLTGYRVLPGLIDTHMHGGSGADTMDGTAEAVEKMASYLAQVGVTTFFPTTVTSSLARTEQVLGVVAGCMERGVPGAKLGGIYLEGPYINKKMKGAHPEEFIREISLAELQALLAAGRGKVRTVAIAPEKPGAVEATRYLCGQGVTVTLGHSDATCEQTLACIAAGARAGIHVYNAMRPLNHREPGILGTALTTDGFAVELICDGIHIDPRCMEIVLRCKHPEDIVLITDCMCAGGMADGRYMLGELPTVVKGGIARTESGALAGSTLKLMNAVKNMVELVGVPFETALRFATENPARQLGLAGSIGSLQKGMAADVVAIDDNYNVVFTMVDGNIVFNKTTAVG